MQGLPRDATKIKPGATVDAEASRDHSLPRAVRDAAGQTESKIIMDALEQHQWNRRLTAAALRISYRSLMYNSLMYKMKTCNLRDAALSCNMKAAREGSI